MCLPALSSQCNASHFGTHPPATTSHLCLHTLCARLRRFTTTPGPPAAQPVCMAPAESEGPWQPDHGFLTQLTRRRSPSSCCMPAHNAMGGDPANSNNSDHCCAHDHHSHNSHNSSSPGHKHTAACCHAGSQGCDSHQQQQHSGHQHAAAACCGGGHDSNRSACSSAAAAHAPATPFGAPQIASVPLQQAGQLMHTSSSGGPVTTRIHAAAICCKFVCMRC